MTTKEADQIQISYLLHTTSGKGRCGLVLARRGLLRYLVAEIGLRPAAQWAKENKTGQFVQLRFKSKDDRALFMQRFTALTAKATQARFDNGDRYAFSPMSLHMVK